MSADWFYLHHSFFGGQKTVGPMTEHDFRSSIEKGKIRPETMVSSTTKTHGRWMQMQKIPVALKLYKQTHPMSRS